MQINVAAWVEKFAPALFGLSCAAAVALYALRRTDGPVPLAWASWGIASMGAAILTATFSRRAWYRSVDARVLLESTLRMDAALSAAAVGVTAWPKPRAPLPAIIRWRSLAAPGWLVGSLLMLTVGAWAPLMGRVAASRPPIEKPPALAQTEAMLQELAKLEVSDPASLEQFSARARELAGRPAEEQYSHSALEAADTLRDQTMAAVQTLAQNYDSAASALAADAMDAKSEKDSAELAAALDGLRTGRLGANRDLASAFKNRRQLSAQQMNQLRQQLNQAGAQARGIAGAAGAGAKVAHSFPSWREAKGGAGAVTRGRGDAPLTMSAELASRLEGREQKVGNDDLSRASLGDFAGTEDSGAHDVDPTKVAGPMTAGVITATARGGEAVWVDRLSPADRAAMRDFFK